MCVCVCVAFYLFADHHCQLPRPPELEVTQFTNIIVSNGFPLVPNLVLTLKIVCPGSLIGTQLNTGRGTFGIIAFLA